MKGVAPGMACHDRCTTVYAITLTKYYRGVDPSVLAEWELN